jgi:hypothetical protein
VKDAINLILQSIAEEANQKDKKSLVIELVSKY